jgi:hypothetical protein
VVEPDHPDLPVRTGDIIPNFEVDPKNGLANPKNWGNEIRLTPRPFDMELAPVTGAGFFLGDYEGLVASIGNKFLAVFIQTGTAGAGTWAAFAVTFGPNDKSDNNVVYSPGGSGFDSTPSSTVTAPDGLTLWMGKKHKGFDLTDFGGHRRSERAA